MKGMPQGYPSSQMSLLVLIRIYIDLVFSVLDLKSRKGLFMELLSRFFGPVLSFLIYLKSLSAALRAQSRPVSRRPYPLFPTQGRMGPYGMKSMGGSAK
uniref:Uncharacterized protein n=1 Tax=Utricularia reniformis TaxID=192314 RepID=A0A1Y0B1B2_9LAMI|nr:hypothetical protein AEK19_MT0941 [Utricularia reniformis]ART31164.1 hypothetical protein AEK19_MT0941 [Utricularia reniformis]